MLALAVGLCGSSVKVMADQGRAVVPAISPDSGLYSSTQIVTITDATPGAVIYYTVNGFYPNASSQTYSGPFPISTSAYIQAIAIAPDGHASRGTSATYTFPAAPPILSPAPGAYSSIQTVTLASPTPAAKIYYTIDGSTPSQQSNYYAGPITVSSNQTIQAVAYAYPFFPSTIAGGVYAITLPPSTPLFSPGAGTYSSNQTVGISDSTVGAAIYFTTDGSTPTINSTPYTGPISVTASETVQAVAIVSGKPPSAVGSASYTLNFAPAAPVISPPAAKYTSIQSVTISDATAGAAIYYTTDGSTPTANSTLYTGAISVATPQTVQAIAVATPTGQPPTPSSISSNYYYIVLPTAVPVISPAGGTYSSAQTVTITDATPGAIIYYQLGGGYPSTSSAIYQGPITATNETIIRTLAQAPNYSVSRSTRADYTIIAPAPSISPSSGSFAESATVTISDVIAGATIYYTLDGTVPTIWSPVYNGPITITPGQTSTETVQSMAIASGYQASAISESQFTIIGSLLAAAQVNTSPSMTIPPNFLGLGHDLSTASQIIGQASTGYNAPYRQLLANLQANLTGPLPIRINGDHSTLSALQSVVEPLNEVAQNVNVHLELGVDMYTNNPSLAQSETTAYTSVIPAQYIDAIEIGNEPDDYYENAYHPSTYSVNDYMTDIVTWDQAVATGSGGNIPLMEASYASLPWIPATEASIGAGTFAPAIVSQHYYVTGVGASNLAPDVLLQPWAATAGPLKYSAFAASAHQAGLLFRMGELNSCWDGGIAGISDTFSSALWALDTSFEYVNDGMDGVNWYSANYSKYQLFEFKSHVYKGTTYYNLNFVTPIYYGLLGFSQVAGHGAQLLPVNTSTTANVKIWATVDNTSTVHVVVINKDESATGDVQIALPGFTTGTVRYLSAPSYTSTNGVTLGGQTFDNSTDGTIQGQLVTATISSVNGVFTLPSMPVTSAAFIDFSY